MLRATLHVVLIVADDMGYSDLGCHWGSWWSLVTTLACQAGAPWRQSSVCSCARAKPRSAWDCGGAMRTGCAAGGRGRRRLLAGPPAPRAILRRPLVVVAALEPVEAGDL